MVLVLTMAACSGGRRDGGTWDYEEVEMRHAELLKMHEGDGFTHVEIRNPWDTAMTLHSYVLVPADRELPAHLPKGDIVRTPLGNAAVYTSVHCGLMDELGAFEAIKGVGDLDYNYLRKVHEGVEKGGIKDIGESMVPNIERIIDMAPDAILLSPFESSGSYGKLGKLQIPLIECADYMETSPLGRAEWVRFYGALFGVSDKADSIFAEVERAYNALKAKATAAESRPTVVADLKTGAIWYVAGAHSTPAIMYADAGADYIFKDVDGIGSVPYAPEMVFDRAQAADVWLFKYNQSVDKTRDELAAEYSHYAQMKAFTTGGIYFCNLGRVPFYEETPFHPERILRDFVIIFHPELMKGEKTRYFKRL